MPRTYGPETLITIYSEQTKTGHYRYMFMCPVRLAALLNPSKIMGEATKRSAIRLIKKAVTYHMEQASSVERMKELSELLKKYNYAPSNLD
jgi:hypothetical protein